MRIKICGITQASQGRAIVQAGATALGFISVKASPRYISPKEIARISQDLPPCDRIGVVANASREEIVELARQAPLTGIQLHGNESPEFCQTLRQQLPGLELIKALRIRQTSDLEQSDRYQAVVDSLLLDAYHPQQLGGTGQTLDWQALRSFEPAIPWFLAGGLTPDNITQALTQLHPQGIDLSSGVERSPGDKDLDKVHALFQHLSRLT
ncbi:phosphoribosylanthranilate isomerase [Phormidium yuhuli AB48]|uniref:N-(5'-phosphoribosyl)anthranilate isomerase n=1 Tax=Phormidium yuhuli AB48 TaxID=2940671 RepID=A0ABY5AVG2_9CYAN|nr:phosphoribosylanthranilate isomerase [Phormidium yuhuli]USR93225.1 phosphoribosylanthranilate isomerase [Phormidium yuhuli AB48]